MTPRLKELYYKEIQPALKEQLGFKNTFQGPKVTKVVINMGLGLDGADAKIMKSTEEDLGKITGQKPTVTKFKKSVANFKTRKGTNAGLKVTLRGNKMYEFIDRLVNIAHLELKILEAYHLKVLINLVITLLESKSILFFLKLILTE